MVGGAGQICHGTVLKPCPLHHAGLSMKGVYTTGYLVLAASVAATVGLCML